MAAGVQPDGNGDGDAPRDGSRRRGFLPVGKMKLARCLRNGVATILGSVTSCGLR